MEHLTTNISKEEIKFYKEKAIEKINAEGWKGRNTEQKVENFVNCWVTEEAFKQLLMKNGAFFRHRGLYVGDAAGAGADFEVKKDGNWITIGIRSIGANSLYKWRSVAYPEDRFLEEQHKIPDYVIACTNEEGAVKFLGIIKKETLLDELGKSKRRKSKANQEYFRKAPLEKFSIELLAAILQQLDKR